MLRTWYRRVSLVPLAVLLPLASGCEWGQITATTTTTLDTRQIVIGLVQSALITPLNNAVNNAVNNFFDRIDDD